MEEADHRLIVEPDVRVQARDPMLACRVGEQCEHLPADAAALVGVVHGDRQLRLGRRVRIGHAAGDGDETVGAIALGRDQRDVVVPIDLRRVSELGLGEVNLGCVEAVLVRVGRGVGEGVEDPHAVIGTDWPHRDRR